MAISTVAHEHEPIGYQRLDIAKHMNCMSKMPTVMNQWVLRGSGRELSESLRPTDRESTGDTAKSMVTCQNGAEKGRSSAGSGKGKNFGEGE